MPNMSYILFNMFVKPLTSILVCDLFYATVRVMFSTDIHTI